MRSRYTAYCLIDIDYIARTMKSPAADDFDVNATTQWAKNTKWTKLEIVQSSSEKTTGTVEFIAHCIVNNKKETLHEVSKFHLKNGIWYYVDGILPDTKSSPYSSEKIGRNDPCVCNSGKKYKKCCGQSV